MSSRTGDKVSARERLYSTGEATDLLGIPATTQIDWEKKGYLMPSRRAGSHRRYGEAELRRLLQVKVLTERYRFREDIRKAIERGEAADVELPPEQRDDYFARRDVDHDREWLIDLAARNAQLFGEQRTLAKELFEAKEQYRSLVQSAHYAIVGLTTDGIITSWNSGAQLLYGYDAEEVLGRSLFIVVPRERSHELSQALDRVKQGGHVEYYEAERSRKDGTRAWVAVSMSPVFDASGRVRGASVIAHDISKRREAEQERRSTDERHRCLIEHSEEGIVLIDQDGRIVEWNRAQERITGVIRSEAIGQHPWDLELSLAAQGIDRPEAREETRALILGMLASDQSPDVWNADELTVARPDGTTRVVQQSIFPVPTAKGRLLAGTLRDVTEQVQAHRLLERRLEMSEIATAVSSRLFKLAPTDDLDGEMSYALGSVGEFAGADYCYFAWLRSDGVTIERIHEWWSDGVQGRRDELSGFSLEQQAWALGKQRRLEPLIVARLDDLPPEAEAERRFLSSRGVRSFLSIPLVLGSEPIGSIGMDARRTERAWTDEEVKLLRLVGEMLANVLERRRAEAELRQSEERHSQIGEEA